MLERLTDHALEAVVAAREAARECRHEHADAPHLLLGILRSPSTTGCLVLNHAGLRHDDVRERVERMYEQAGERPGRVALTPQAKRLLDLALHEARSEQEPLVATKHLALACSRAAALAVPGYGRLKATKVLQHCRISANKTIGGLSSRQRAELMRLPGA